MTQTIETYLDEGCGRCPLGGTPQCKVHPWRNHLEQLRAIALSCGLNEEIKWGVPCYTYQSQNIFLLSAFKDFCALSFFKGALLKDPNGILQRPGKNTQAARLIKITHTSNIAELTSTIRAYIMEAIEVEKAGLKITPKKKSEPIPAEFQQKLDELPDLHQAFYALTPGRQRAYIIHFSQPKQTKTRVSRIEKCMPKIMDGKGFHDR